MKNKLSRAKNCIVLTLLILSSFLVLFSASGVLAQSGLYTSPYAYYGEEARFYFPTITDADCEAGAGQDFLVQLMPGGCEPTVVRSDLLEEQNIPVFCRLVGIKINPLIEVPRIKSITIPAKAEKNIVGTTFHPYRKGISSPFPEATGSVVWDNLGYLVVMLKRQPVEAKMPEFIEENLTARITYDMEKSAGINANQRVLREIDDNSWMSTYTDYGFWSGRGYLRVSEIKEDSARVSIYNNPSAQPIASPVIIKGKDYGPIYMPGFYCSSGVILRIDDLTYPEITAQLIVDGDIVDVSSGDKFADGLCEVASIEPSSYDVIGKIDINCRGNRITLIKESIKANLRVSYLENSIQQTRENEWNVGDLIHQKEKDNYYLVSSGRQMVAKSTQAKAGLETFDYAIIAKVPRTSKLQSSDIKKLNDDLRGFFEKEFKASDYTKLGFHNKLNERFKSISGFQLFVIDSQNRKVDDLDISVSDVSGMINVQWPDYVEEEYGNSIKAYTEVYENWRSVKSAAGQSYGLVALLNSAEKAKELGKTFDEAGFLNSILDNYGDSNETKDAKRMLADIAVAASRLSRDYVTVGDRTISIELSKIEEPKPEDMSVSLSIDNSVKTYYKYSTLDKPLDSWMIQEIKEKEITVVNSSNIQQKFTFVLGQESQFMSHRIRLAKVNLNKVAKVSVLPYSRNGSTVANFTFRAYIEKRTVKLSPEQTKDAITSLNKSIGDLEKVIKDFGNVLQTWKGVCLATSGALWAKNFFDNLFSGASGVARKLVMRGDVDKGITGWTQQCADQIGFDKKYKSFAECYAANSQQIQKEIDITKQALESNDKIFNEAKDKAQEEGRPFLGIFPTKITNQNTLMESLEKLDVPIPSDFKYSKDGKEISITSDKIKNVVGKTSELSSKYTLFESDARTLFLNLAVLKQCESSDAKIAERLCNNAKQLAGAKIDYLNEQLVQIDSTGGFKDILEASGLSDLEPAFIGKVEGAYAARTINIKIDDFKAGSLYAKTISKNINAMKNVNKFLDDQKKLGQTSVRIAALSTGKYYLVLLKSTADYVKDEYNFYKMQVAVEVSPQESASLPAPPLEMPASQPSQISTPASQPSQTSTTKQLPTCNLNNGYEKLKSSTDYLKTFVLDERIKTAVEEKNNQFAVQLNNAWPDYKKLLSIEGKYNAFTHSVPAGTRRYLTTKFGKYICYLGYHQSIDKTFRPRVYTTNEIIIGYIDQIAGDDWNYALETSDTEDVMGNKLLPSNVEKCINDYLEWEKENCVTTPPVETKPILTEQEAQKAGTKVEAKVTGQGLDINDILFIKESTSLQNCDNNPYKDAPVIKFWENEPYKGLVAIMPVDMKRGGYIATTAYGSGTEAYMESGQVKAFWMCNVGQNGKPDFDSSLGSKGDDKCTLVQMETWDKLGIVLCSNLNAAESSRLVYKAIGCMREAAKQYGKSKVVTQCGEFEVGSPPVSLPTQQCEDFMDPLKCDIMYNVCDPVICPSSRCNLGGAYTVDNVVQTGVIGSLALCLPNGIGFGGGKVLVPVCLTGIHAGLDNWLSIMKATKACLEESLKSGKEIGICDELKSIYLCEFFWRQFSPFLKVGIPSLINAVSGTTKAGGEYLSVNNAFQNAADSAKYITDYYGVNAWNAFKARTTEQAGTDICKAFVSLSYPNQADLFNEMTKPESPPQINAWFSETPLQTITTPPVSQYKVYWHIYAGRDQSVYYVITLKEPPSTTYYNIPETQTIASGFIPQGEYVDVTKDFQAAFGYKKICVRLSGVGIGVKDYCGFGKVSEDFALNELSGLYAKEQATQNIGNEQECISGSASLLPIAMIPNLQAGVQEAISPEIYKKGIVRVCSSDNPGQGVGTTRWIRVGFCNSAKTVGCWLDQNSVKQVIKDLGLENETLNEAKQISNQLLTSEGYWDDTTCADLWKLINDNNFDKNVRDIKQVYFSEEGKAISRSPQFDAALKNLDSLDKNLTKLIEKCIGDNWKAKSQLQIGDLHNKLVIQLKKLSPIPSAIKTSTTQTSTTQKTITTTKTSTTQAQPCTAYWANENGVKIISAKVGENVKMTMSADCVGSYVFSIMKKNVFILDALARDELVITQGENSYMFDEQGEYYFNAVPLQANAKEIVSSSLKIGPNQLAPINVFFEYKSSVLSSEMTRSIYAKFASDIAKIKNNAEVTIEGYASSEGTEAYNLQLSRNRALAVSTFIGQEFRSTIVSKGILLRPSGKGETFQFGDDLSKNRRVVVTVKSP